MDLAYAAKGDAHNHSINYYRNCHLLHVMPWCLREVPVLPTVSLFTFHSQLDVL